MKYEIIKDRRMKIVSLLVFSIIFQIISGNVEIITILQNELKHHQIKRPELDDRVFLEKKIKGDMYLNRLNLSIEKDLKNYLKHNLNYRIDKFEFLEAIKFTNSTTIHNYLFIYSFADIVLKEYIAVASRSSNDKNLIYLLIVYTEVTLPIPNKKTVQELTTCEVFFGQELCRYFSKNSGTSEYNLREILKFEKAAKYYSFLKFQQIINNTAPNLSFLTESNDELSDFLKDF